MRLTGWKKVFPGDHIEQMRGTLAENDAYCSKESAIIQFGLKPMDNGKKRSLKLLCEAVVEAANDQIPLCDVVTMPDNQATFVQYNNGITKLYDHAVTSKLRKIDKNFAPEVIYISGPPGSGKTRYVFDKEPDLYRVPASDKFKWKDGYCGQDAVLYDNVTPENIAPNELLVEIDRYYVSLPQKGGFTGWRPKRIYFTSVFTLGLFSETARFSLAAEFTRRITSSVLCQWLWLWGLRGSMLRSSMDYIRTPLCKNKMAMKRKFSKRPAKRARSFKKSKRQRPELL